MSSNKKIVFKPRVIMWSNGRMFERGVVISGIKKGLWQYWYSDGSEWLFHYYVDNQIEGEQIELIYFPSSESDEVPLI